MKVTDTLIVDFKGPHAMYSASIYVSPLRKRTFQPIVLSHDSRNPDVSLGNVVGELAPSTGSQERPLEKSGLCEWIRTIL